MFRYLIALLILIILAAPAAAAVSLNASHNSGVDHISIALFQAQSAGDAGVVVVREIIGVCDAAVTVSPEVYPLPEVWDDNYYLNPITYAFDVSAPAGPVTAVYIAKILKLDGSLEIPGPSIGLDQGPAWYAGPLTAPLVRGVWTAEYVDEASGFGAFSVEICPNDCWLRGGRFAFHGEIELATAMPFVGQVVDVFGTAMRVTMPGTPAFELDHLALAPDGACGPVPNRAVSWSGLKAMYR